MIRKFECKACKMRFEADDSNAVICPHCQSDNVEYAQFRISSKVWKICGGIVVFAGLICAAIFVDWKGLFPKNEENLTTDSIDMVEVKNDSIYMAETGLELPPEIEITELNFEGEGYSFDMKVKYLKTSNIYFAVLDPYNDKKIIAKSNDGHFTNVPYSKADGSIYTLAVYDAQMDTILCKKAEVTGFIKQKSVSKKMTVAELQAKIDKRDQSLIGVGENDYLSPDYTLTFVGLPKDAPNKPKNLYDVFEKLDMETWVSVTVSSLDYDDMNRISGITLKVKESNDNF